MRTASSGLKTAEQLSVLKPNYRVVAADEVMHFAFSSNIAGTSLETALPQDYISDGTHIWACWTKTDGSTRVKYIDPSSSSNFALTDGSSVQIAAGSGVCGCLRPQITTEGGVPILYDAYLSGSNIQVRRAFLTGTSNPLTLSWSDYGAPLPLGFTLSATECIRVETVCPTYSSCIVVIGYHSTAMQMTALMFFLVTPSTTKRLLLTVEDTMTLSSFPNWHAHNRVWANASAVGTYDKAAFTYNTLAAGRSEIITVNRGVCSERKGVIATDIEQTTHRFLAHKLFAIGPTNYMLGHFNSVDTDGLNEGYEGYAVSNDLETWSVAAREHYLVYPQLRGGLVSRFLLNEPNAWYAGGGQLWVAPHNVYSSGFDTARTTDISLDVLGLEIDQASNAADTLMIVLNNPIQGSGLGLYDAHPRVKRGGLLKVEMGYGSDWVNMGVYSIDELKRSASSRGMSSVTLRAREQAGKKLADVHMTTDVQISGRYTKRVDLTADSLDGIEHKTEVQAYEVGKNGLVFKGLNTPSIFFLDAPTRDGWVFATVRFKVQNSYHIGTFSFLFDVTVDDNEYASGYVAIVPKQHNWTGHIHNTVEVRRFKLPAVDLNDADKAQTGFNLSERINCVLEAVGTGPNLITEVPPTVSYLTQNVVHANNGIPADQDTELAFGYRGSVISVYQRPLNLAPNSVADSSQWQLLTEVFLDRYEFYVKPTRRYLGIMLNHDVWVDTGSLDQVEIGDMELALTNAQQVSGDPVVYAYAYSGMDTVSDAGTKVKYIDPGAIKYSKIVAGRAAFVSNDNSAFMTRLVQSDGVMHHLVDANWPTVNPIPVGSTDSYGSEPESWRMLLHHGRVNASAMTSFGLPDGNSAPAYVLVNDEKIRYRTVTYTKADASAGTWTVVPCYYAVLASMTANSATLTQWTNGAGAYPGDKFNEIPDLQGLLVEFTARNFESGNEGSVQYYATGTSTAGPPATMTIDKAFPGTLGAKEALAIISGRAQWGTEKVSHDESSPCVFAPLDSAGNLPSIVLSRLAFFGGTFVSVEDVVRRCCGYAGVGYTSFRPSHANADVNTWSTLTVTTSPQALNIRENMSDFVLDMRVHIPGNVVGAGAAERKLYVDFRGFYRFVIQQKPTAADCQAGYFGVLSVGLQTTSSEVGVGADGNRWLGRVSVRVASDSQAGAVTGSGANWSTAEDVSIRSNVRLAVLGDQVVVDVNGVNVFTFDLDALKGTSYNWARYNSAGISVSGSDSIGSWVCDYWVSDLDDSVEDFVVQQNGAMRASIDMLTSDRHLWSRSTEPVDWLSGVHFDRYWIRDDVGAVKENMITETRTSADDRLVGHVRVSGTECQADVFDHGVLQTHGYKFEQVSNPVIKTAKHCRDEGRLWLREQAEASVVRTIDGLARLEIQPGDKGTFGYSMGSYRPFMADEVHTIVSCRIQATREAARETFEIRKFVSI